jgi:F-box/leucine-rich repeat protein 6
MMADLNKKMKQISRRRSKPKAVYQSQISDNSVGIKLCIKKSINTSKPVPSPNSKSPSPRKRSRKSKAQPSKGKEKGCESDSDDSYVKRRKKPSTMNNNNNSNKFEEPIEQSGWGKLIPKEVLSEVC